MPTRVTDIGRERKRGFGADTVWATFLTGHRRELRSVMIVHRTAMVAVAARSVRAG
jgi:hypothetical protein